MAKAKKMKQAIFKPKAKRATLIYIFLLPMFVSTILELFNSNYLPFLTKLVGFALLVGSAKLIDRGLNNEFIYNSANLAIAPKIKYKLIGSISLVIALIFISILTTNINPINSIFSSIIGGVGAFLYYGKDPTIDKLPKDKGVNYQKILDSLSKAKDKLNYIDKEQEKIEDIELKSAIKSTTAKAHEILKTIEDDPKDITIVRKFMVVYLDGVKDVIAQYNSIDKELLDSEYRLRLINLLKDATTRFDSELERLKSNEIFDLDVQIDALKEQLKN